MVEKTPAYIKGRFFDYYHHNKVILDIFYENKYYGTVKYHVSMDKHAIRKKNFLLIPKSEEDLAYILLKYDIWQDNEYKNL